MTDDYAEVNRKSWNRSTELHLAADWYRHEAFAAGECSLKPIELALLGEVAGQSILHLQCHFGQDTLSLARMGARVVGVDISDRAIEEARRLTAALGLDARFVRCDVYALREHLDERFDRVFVSYGAIGWLPDLERWARLVADFLKPGGELILVEFHPFLWTFDDDFETLKYDYSSPEPIVEESDGTYGAPGVKSEPLRTIGWNHGLGEVVSRVLGAGLRLTGLREHDWSPYDCFSSAVEFAPGRFRVGKIPAKIPLVYALTAVKDG